MSEQVPKPQISREAAEAMYLDAKDHIQAHYDAQPDEASKGYKSGIKGLPEDGSSLIHTSSVSRDMHMEYVPPWSDRHNMKGGRVAHGRHSINIHDGMGMSVNTVNNPQDKETQYSAYELRSAIDPNDHTNFRESGAPKVVRQLTGKDGKVEYYRHKFKGDNVDKAANLVLKLAQKRVDRSIENASQEHDKAA